MVLGPFPKAIAITMLLLFSAGIFSPCHAQDDKKQTARDNRSDSQKSYVAPRTHDTNRSTGGNNAANKQTRLNRNTGTAEKKLPTRK